MYMKTRKRWWLAPILVMLLLMSALVVLTEGSAVAPFIYAIF
jgi:hypothetical protein